MNNCTLLSSKLRCTDDFFFLNSVFLIDNVQKIKHLNQMFASGTIKGNTICYFKTFNANPKKIWSVFRDVTGNVEKYSQRSDENIGEHTNFCFSGQRKKQWTSGAKVWNSRKNIWRKYTINNPVSHMFDCHLTGWSLVTNIFFLVSMYDHVCSDELVRVNFFQKMHFL